MEHITIPCTFCGWRGDGCHIADPAKVKLARMPLLPLCGICLAKVNLGRLKAQALSA